MDVGAKTHSFQYKASPQEGARSRGRVARIRSLRDSAPVRIGKALQTTYMSSEHLPRFRPPGSTSKLCTHAAQTRSHSTECCVCNVCEPAWFSATPFEITPPKPKPKLTLVLCIGLSHVRFGSSALGREKIQKRAAFSQFVGFGGLPCWLVELNQPFSQSNHALRLQHSRFIRSFKYHITQNK